MNLCDWCQENVKETLIFKDDHICKACLEDEYQRAISDYSEIVDTVKILTLRSDEKASIEENFEHIKKRMSAYIYEILRVTNG